MVILPRFGLLELGSGIFFRVDIIVILPWFIFRN